MSSWLEFLERRGAVIAAGRVASFGDAGAELAAARDAAILCDLSHNALVEATGDDAAAFLHGQLTNDVEGLVPGAAQWTGWCTPKGRLVASFLLARLPGRFLFMLPAEIAEPVRKRLSMFVLRSKVKLADVSAQWVRMGVAGPEASAAVAHALRSAPAAKQVVEHDGVVAIGLDSERYLVIAPLERAEPLWETLATKAKPAGSAAWEWKSIRAGIPTVVGATQEAFVPQMANFDLIDAVSFRKGCYPGQEIVARTQYRGGLKRRMALVHIDGEGAAVAPGQSLFSEAFGEQAAGMVANAAPAPGGGADALVVAQIESLERDDLRWGTPGGPEVEILQRPSST
jgi:folate-binding protein YgfZ